MTVPVGLMNKKGVGERAKKNPDSSPAPNVWERNYRDCIKQKYKINGSTLLRESFFNGKNAEIFSAFSC
jgi:hypothetical protein